MAAESLYVALLEMDLTDASLGRSLDTLERSIQEMELRYDLGQISALTLQQVTAGRTSLVSGRQTLAMNRGSASPSSMKRTSPASLNHSRVLGQPSVFERKSWPPKFPIITYSRLLCSLSSIRTIPLCSTS